MRTGGSTQTTEAMHAIRALNACIAPVVSLYALMVMSGLVASSHPVNLLGTAITAYLWLGLGLYYYFKPSQSLSARAARLTSIHLLFFAMCIFGIGFTQPFALVYAALFLESYLFFGRKGFVLSVTSFMGAAFYGALLWGSTDPALVLSTITTVTAVVGIGSAVVWVVSAQETSRRVLLHSQDRERLQYDRMVTIINNLSDAAFTTDSSGSILIYNAACLNLLDTNDNLHGKNIGDLFNLTMPDSTALNLFTILRQAAKTTTRDDLIHTYGDGEAIRLEATFSPIRSSYSVSKHAERQGGYIIIMRDVTKQKSLEEQRDEFISVVSHELRTPITIVEGTLSNLDVMLKQPTPPAQALLSSSITTAHEQVLYLARMVNDLSTLSRAERGVADTPELIDVTELLHGMHRQYEHEAAVRGLRLDLQLGTKLGSVTASRLYLEELLQNFITNGIKYTNEGNVTISAWRKGKTISFAVSDTGIGMSRSDQQKVFQKFYRSEDYRIRETNGTGLGLYVAAKLAHKLGAHIELKSRLNHGSTFSFELLGE